jgi:hypothetical protein
LFKNGLRQAFTGKGLTESVAIFCPTTPEKGAKYISPFGISAPPIYALATTYGNEYVDTTPEVDIF